MNRQLTRMEMKNEQRQRIERLLLPSEIGLVGNIAVVNSDLTPTVVSALMPFTTGGNKVWTVRLPYTSFGIIQQTAAVDASTTFYWQLSAAGNGPDYAAAFDQYRIIAAQLNFSPQLGKANFPSGAVNPRLYTVIDYDDATNITRAQASQYETLVVAPPSTGVVRSMVPHLALAAYSGAFTSYANTQWTWIDCNSSAVQHYGVKVVIEAGAVGQTVLQAYVCDAYIYCQFRNSR